MDDKLFTDIGKLFVTMKPFFKKLIKETCGSKLNEILLYLPKNYIKRKLITKANEIKENDLVIFWGEVCSCDFRPYGLNKIRVKFNNQIIEIVYFKASGTTLDGIYRIGKSNLISGKITKNSFTGLWQIAHPDYVDNKDNGEIFAIEPNYPLVTGLTNKFLNSLLKQIFEFLKDTEIPEWLDDEILKKKNWPSFFDALKIIHRPINNTTDEMITKAQERLAFDELLANQISLKLLKITYQNHSSRSIIGNNIYRAKVLEKLPFKLTGDQQKAINDIYNDQARDLKMIRMLQGDVGTGKTIVALLGMLNAVECGFQAVLMVPTTILAQQHYESFKEYCEKAELDIDVTLLISTCKKKKVILEKIKTGVAQIIIGTHSLFQDKVEFHQIGLVVIDEQHRFGVAHRQMLTSKDQYSDLLFMSATPIPRSLSLVNYGYMDQSLIITKPINRLPIKTSVLSSTQIDELISKIHTFLERNERVYWICPLIEESEKLNFIAIEKRAIILQEVFQDKLSIVHGRVDDKEVQEIMRQFSCGEKKILLATTAIEVGVNIPEATLIVIEDAQKFGLSQLHQLRGRVGRSHLQSFCMLVYNPQNTSPTSKMRMQILKESNDGFYIAEQDLKIRGSGELTGSKQSGFNKSNPEDTKKNNNLLDMASDLSCKIATIYSKRLNLPIELKMLLKIFNINDPESNNF